MNGTSLLIQDLEVSFPLPLVAGERGPVKSEWIRLLDLVDADVRARIPAVCAPQIVLRQYPPFVISLVPLVPVQCPFPDNY